MAGIKRSDELATLIMRQISSVHSERMKAYNEIEQLELLDNNNSEHFIALIAIYNRLSAQQAALEDFRTMLTQRGLI